MTRFSVVSRRCACYLLQLSQARDMVIRSCDGMYYGCDISTATRLAHGMGGKLTSHQHGSRRRTRSGYIIICVAQRISVAADCINVRGLNLGTKATAVAKPEIVGYYNEKVWSLLR